MTDLESGYAIVEGVYGNLIIYKDDKPFIPTNLEPMDETDEAWDKIGAILDALIDERAQGRIEGLQEAAGECTTLAAAYHQEAWVEFEKNDNMSNKETRSLADKASGAGSAANAIRAIIRKESE